MGATVAAPARQAPVSAGPDDPGAACRCRRILTHDGKVFTHGTNQCDPEGAR